MLQSQAQEPETPSDMASQNEQAVCHHAAMDVAYHLPLDTYHSLFDHVFESDVFNQWRSDGRSWQLRVVGGPGTGKTTLSAITTQRLRSSNETRKVGVASIFVKNVVAFGDQTFLQAFLESVYYQLSHDTGDMNELANNTFVTYKQSASSKTARSMSHRLKLLRKAVYPLIMNLERAFLVIDSIDLCHPSVGDQIEAEFSRLQQHGLSIMTTSRLSQYRSTDTIECDVPTHAGPPGAPATVFWGCKWCWTSEPYVICQDCKDSGALCKKCHNFNLLYEPNERLEIDLGIPDGMLHDFVSWDLEREHGDMNLSSGVEDKPPLSALGRALRDASNVLEELKERIVDRAWGNITIVKLDLDSLIHVHSVDEAFLRFNADRLSANILTMFDDVLEEIKHATDHERHVALCSILAAVHDYGGARFQDIEKWIQESRVDSDSVGSHRLTVHDVLRAAHGFLSLDNSPQQWITPYHEMLGLYANERYDDALFWEHTHLRFGRTMNRSGTMGPALSQKRKSTWSAAKETRTLLKRPTMWQ